MDRLKSERVHGQKFLLPDTSGLCAEESFADVSMGWCEEGLELHIEVNVPFRSARYPAVELGDSVELFVDTRDVKSSGFNTRFCHHFFFLAEGVDGHFAGEITHFRTEDTHPLCDPAELKTKSTIKKNGYTLHLFIPRHCLHGYDPTQFNRLGFSYRINRAEGFPQHLSVTTDDFTIDQQPALWSSFKLEK
ncbi:MAG: hypothetical protein WCF65_05440 [Parachlamydiaceae bacterium]